MNLITSGMCNMPIIAIVRICVLMGATAILLWGLWVGMEKEFQRMVALSKANCEAYGEAINRTEGREVCPPTPYG